MNGNISPRVLNIAEALMDRGVFLKTIKGSLLDDLVNEYCDTVKPNEVCTVEGYVSKINDLLIASRPNIFVGFEDNNDNEGGMIIEGNTVDIVAQTAVDNLHSFVSEIMENVNTIVLPTISAIVTELDELMQARLSGADIKVTIVNDDSAFALWNNPLLHELFDSLSDDEVVPFSTTRNVEFEDLSIEVLSNALPTGLDLLDAEIAEYLGNYDLVELIEHTFHEVFARNEPGEYVGQSKLAEAVVAFLLANKFLADTPDGASGVEINSFNIEMRAIATHYRNIIKSTIEQFNFAEKYGRLIISTPTNNDFYTTGSEFRVNGRLINKFYELGGTADGILGSVITEHGYVTDMETLLARNTAHENAWHAFMRLEESRLMDNYHRIYVSNLRTLMFKYAAANGYTINESDVDCIFEVETTVTRETGFAFASALINDVFFGNKEYKIIISKLGETCIKYPEMTKEEAMNYVLIDWLVEWAVSQIKIG